MKRETDTVCFGFRKDCEFKPRDGAHFVVGPDGYASILTPEVKLISAVENAAGKTRDAAVGISDLYRDVSVLLSQDGADGGVGSGGQPGKTLVK
jgi:hypothetical protein